IPRPVSFKRSQRTPAHVSESEANAQSATAAPAEEADQRGSPVMPPAERTRIPCPAVAAHVPVAVVIGSPAPGIAADPGPAIEVYVFPAAHSIGRPAGIHRGHPDVSIRRIVLPLTIGIQILGAINIRRDVASADGALQSAIAIGVPTVPVVIGNSRDDHILWIRRSAASLHGAAGGQALRTPWAENIGAAGSYSDLGGAVGENRDAITSLLRGPHGNRGSADFDIGIVVAQHAKHRGAAGDLDQIASVLQLADANFGRVTQANHISRVELNFGRGVLSGGQKIVDQERSVGCRGGQVAGIATPHGDVAIHQADAGYAVVGRIAAVLLLLLCPSWQDRRA